MRRMGFCKDCMRVKVFKNEGIAFDYHSPGTDEILSIGGDIRGGDQKALYRLGEEVFLQSTAMDALEGSQRLCIITNDYSADNRDGKWWVEMDPTALPAGLAIPPGQEEELEDGDQLYFGLTSRFDVYKLKETFKPSLPNSLMASGDHFPEIIASIKTQSSKELPMREENLNSKGNINGEIKTRKRDAAIILKKQGNPSQFLSLLYDSYDPANEFSVGSDPSSDLVLEESSTISAHHATIKRSDEILTSDILKEKTKKALHMAYFFCNCDIKDSVFKIYSEGEYGVILYRPHPFCVEPNTMRVFQAGNLLIQISRYQRLVYNLSLIHI
eukprot:TRINITY_DN12720_c0_g1_i1.p1 TRINITY_DN12720_c0_g1~~TRINITY_DN12720_c0_g1_i1.p1  ORF type:complete len:338 (-),score=48.72 TRINITY_DN12720_c0_g1_i1:152-1135(-)